VRPILVPALCFLLWKRQERIEDPDTWIRELNRRAS